MPGEHLKPLVTSAWHCSAHCSWHCSCEMDYQYKFSIGECRPTNRCYTTTSSIYSEHRTMGILAINDEELVDTVRKSIFVDRELVRIYYGTLRLGIDLHKAKPQWLHVENDSIVVANIA